MKFKKVKHVLEGKITLAKQNKLEKRVTGNQFREISASRKAETKCYHCKIGLLSVCKRE